VDEIVKWHIALSTRRHAENVLLNYTTRNCSNSLQNQTIVQSVFIYYQTLMVRRQVEASTGLAVARLFVQAAAMQQLKAMADEVFAHFAELPCHC
jgi:hypothetical protein